jgi:hypothetical protein
MSDDDFRTALMSIDSNIVHHIEFLNGVVHQIAAGQVHLALWQLILDSPAMTAASTRATATFSSIPDVRGGR